MTWNDIRWLMLIVTLVAGVALLDFYEIAGRAP